MNKRTTREPFKCFSQTTVLSETTKFSLGIALNHYPLRASILGNKKMTLFLYLFCSRMCIARHSMRRHFTQVKSYVGLFIYFQPTFGRKSIF